MASVSQNGRRKPRPWTAQDQILAEVAAACGVTLSEIGRILNRPRKTVKSHLVPASAKKIVKYNLRWRKENPEKFCESKRRSYQANRHEMLKYARRYRVSNREALRAYARRYYQLNNFNVREAVRRYRNANQDKAAECIARWRTNNLAKVRNYRRAWKENNPNKLRELSRRRNAWKRAARRQSLHPVTRAQIDARFALWSNHCAFCGVDASDPRNHGRDRLTVEHVLALTEGGLDEASNIIPACTACNSSKRNSPVEDWYRQQQFFAVTRWRKIERHCPAAVVGQLPLALAA
jgi:hypothetical protein